MWFLLFIEWKKGMLRNIIGDPFSSHLDFLSDWSFFFKVNTFLFQLLFLDFTHDYFLK